MSKTGKKASVQKEFPQNQYLNLILIALFYILICVFTTYKISIDDDVFWHLATGRYIVQHFQIPHSDVFGFVTYGQKWIPFEWGWDVLTFLIFNLGGFVAISVFRTLIVIAIFSLFFLYIRKNRINITFSVFFLFFLLLGILTRLSIRPQIISYLFTALVIYILINFRNNKKISKTILIFIPAIFLIWANMHMGVVLGFMVMGLFVLAESLDYFIINKNRNSNLNKDKLKILLYTILLVVIAVLINPNFYETFLYTFRHSQMDMLEQINEWKSPFRSEVISNYNIQIYLFYLFTGIFILYYSLKRKIYFPALIYFILGIFSLQAIRFVVDFLIAMFFFWLLTFDSFFKEKKVPIILNKNISKIIISVGLILVIFSASEDTFYKKYLGNHFRESGFGVNEKFFPASMFGFIEREGVNRIGNKPFNNLKIGGYFIWSFPENLNFIDSRNLNDSIYFLYKAIDNKKSGFESLIEKYDIDYFMYSTPYLTVNAGEIKNNIISYLALNPDKWKLLYWDDKSFGCVKNIPKFDKLISKYEYKYISPYNFVFNRDVMNSKFQSDKVNFINEIKRKQSEEPNGIFINDMAKFYNR